MNKKQRQADHSIPFAGSGKLSDYKEDGSWMINQIEKGFDKIDRGVKIIKDEHGNIQFASVHPEKKIAKIAAKIVNASEEIEIDKYYKQLNDFTDDRSCFALKWCLKGDLNGSTINELGVVKELLMNKVDKDLRKLEIIFDVNCEYFGEACVDFENQCIRIETIFSYDINQIDTQEFVDVLEKIGFESFKEEKED